MLYSIKCFICQADFENCQPKSRYCSTKCRNKAYAISSSLNLGKDSSIKNIPTGTVGCLAEMLVSVELMEKGYSVFRALSPTCFCDLISVKDGKMLRIEVRTGYINGSTGKVLFPLKKRGEIDIFAVYIRSIKSVKYYDKDVTLKTKDEIFLL